MAELKMLEARLQDVMKPDPHTGSDGCYLIRSVYFDDLYDRCLNENESGVSPREKWRVRIYNCSDRRISLECKRKEYGMIQKKSCLITREETEQMINMGFVPITGENPALQQDAPPAAHAAYAAQSDRPVSQKTLCVR